MHILIAGVTGSGKTTLACQMAKEVNALGREVIVYDPTRDERWPTGSTSDMKQFVWKVAYSKNALVIIDESPVAHDDGLPLWITTMGRHLGHRVIHLAQRAVMIPRNARDQCSFAAFFRCSSYDATTLSQEWSPETVKCSGLQRGEYLWCDRMGGCSVLRIE